MNLDAIKQQTTWNDAATSINSNFAKLLQAILALEGGGGNEGGGLDESQLEAYLVANGYTTQEWVLAQKFLKEITSEQVIEALQYTPLNPSDADAKYAPLAGFNTLKSDFDALNKALNDDVSGKINTWNEIVDFVDEYSGSEDLATIISGINAEVNKRLLISTYETFLSDEYNPLKTKVGTMEADIDTNTTAIQAVDLKVTNLGNHMTGVDETIVAIQKQTDGINERLVAVETWKETTDTTVKNLSTQVSTNKTNIEKILGWFQLDSSGNLYTTYDFYSTKEISANGLGQGTGGSGGSGMIESVLTVDELGTELIDDNKAVFNAFATNKVYNDLVTLTGRVNNLATTTSAVGWNGEITSGKKIGTLTINGLENYLYIPDKLSTFTDDVVRGKYLPLTGGTLSNGNFNPLTIKGNSSYSGIGFVRSSNDAGYLVYLGGTKWHVTSEGWATGRDLLHSGNYSQYALPLSGGTLTNDNNILNLCGTTNSYIYYSLGSTNKASSGYYENFAFIANETTDARIGIADDGTPQYHTDSHRANVYTLLHSGNYNSYAPTLTGGGASGKWEIAVTKGLYLNDNRKKNEAPYANGDYPTRRISAHFKQKNHIGISETGHAAMLHISPWDDPSGGAEHQLIFSDDGSIRHRYGLTSWASWKTVAFTDSNVASAQALTHSNGTVGATVNSSGNIGIGTTSPSRKLDVAGTIGISSSVGQGRVIAITDSSALSTFGRALSALYPNAVKGAHIDLYVGVANSAKNGGYLGFYYDAAASDNNRISLGLYAKDDVLNINGKGHVLINTTLDSGYELEVNGKAYANNIYGGNSIYAKNYLFMNYDNSGMYLTNNTISWHSGNLYKSNLLEFTQTSVKISQTLSAGATTLSSLTVNGGAVITSSAKINEVTYGYGTISFAGNIQINPTASGARVYLNTSTYGLTCTGGALSVGYIGEKSGYKFYVRSGNAYVEGNIAADGEISANVLNTGSDIRFKNKISDVVLDLDTMANAPMFRFTWNNRKDDRVYIGSSAQYWKRTSARELVSKGCDDFHRLDYSTLGAMMGVSLAKKAKNHENRLENHENRLENHEGRIKELEMKVESLEQENRRLRYGN